MFCAKIVANMFLQLFLHVVETGGKILIGVEVGVGGIGKLFVKLRLTIICFNVICIYHVYSEQILDTFYD